MVWAAEQLEPIRRQVALKVIRVGMDTRQVIARFEAERQVLALTNHPNIARVLDAGATHSGRPYFVMELVDGIPITTYCTERNLDLAMRLDLFIQICHAIQHAHQKGIIHRDIKPSNILVAAHDGKAVPKVIDFGIAKATQQELTEGTLLTQSGHLVGTPAYMSPEQADLCGEGIDTRSDIYSLGVLLYELLTGVTPFDLRELTRRGLDEMRRIIREREPARPSTRIRQAFADGRAVRTETPEGSGAGPGNHPGVRESHEGPRGEAHSSGRQVRECDADLDWIVMKCLEKDRERRYDTALDLAADLERHRANEPILARPPSAAYKFRKAWRRNRVLYSLVAAVAGALVFGISLSLWLANRAIQARDAQKLVAEEMRLRSYVSDMRAAQFALDRPNLLTARHILERQIPGPGQTDLRGLEWRYLWNRAKGGELKVFSSRLRENFWLRPLTQPNSGFGMSRPERSLPK